MVCGTGYYEEAYEKAGDEKLSGDNLELGCGLRHALDEIDIPLGILHAVLPLMFTS